MSDVRPTRRAVLATGLAAAAAFVAGCARAGASGTAGAASASGTAASAAPTSAAAATSAVAAPTSAAAIPAAAWASAVATAEAALVADYTAVIKAHPALKARLNPLLAAHTAHITALTSSLGGAAPAGGTGTDQALSRLAQAEQKASDVAAKQCLTCPTSAAALLGSIAAANASHLVVLAGLPSIGGS